MKPSIEKLLYKPKENDPCLCGSGNAFVVCCSEHLAGLKDGEKVRMAWDNGDHQAALIAHRAELCQYAIWHKRHTAPVQENPKAAWILKTDIEALSHYVGSITKIYFMSNRAAEVPAVLERLRSIVADPRWQRKITYHQALLLDAIGQEAAAKIEFLKLGAIDPETEADVELLQAHLDLLGDTLSFSQRNAVCDRILALTRSATDHIQYRLVKGMGYAGIGDFDEARKQLALAVAQGHMRDKEKPLSARGRMMMAGALSYLGLFTREDRHFTEAEATFKTLIAGEGNWTVEGKAMLWDRLGECYRHWGKWADGDHAYRESLRLQPDAINAIFLAECEMQMGRLESAATLLDSVDAASLSQTEHVDLAYTSAELAVKSNDRERLKSALKVLESVKPTESIFEQRRLSFMVEVQAALANGPGSDVWRILRDAFSQPLRKLNRYFMVQPNICGFGVNVNAIVEDALGPEDPDDKK